MFENNNELGGKGPLKYIILINRILMKEIHYC